MTYVALGVVLLLCFSRGGTGGAVGAVVRYFG